MKEQMKQSERVIVERELNRLMEITLQLEAELVSVVQKE